MQGTRRAAIVLLTLLIATGATGQGIRDRIRLSPKKLTPITEQQASELTLTITPVTTRPIQIWVRTAAIVGTDSRTLDATVPARDVPFVKVGQRVRTFPVESRSSMFQAFVTRVTPAAGGSATVRITLNGPGRDGARRYLAEIITDRGDYLSIPNEAIIEEGHARIVYVKRDEGRYEPQPITAGLQGELYTQVTSGVKDGDKVVTFGSFFIDSEYKLKGTAQSQ